MVNPRLIPCLLIKNGLIVRSQSFRVHQIIGNPMSTVERFSHWNVDELIILDISDEDFHDLRRDDLNIRYASSSILSLLEQIAEVCFMPLAFGGRLRTLEDIQDRLAAGADKCVINSQALKDPQFIREAAHRFGSQSIVVSIDCKKRDDDTYEVYSNGGMTPTGWTPVEWAIQVEAAGAGEIFLNSIDRDGSGEGYDLELIRSVTSQVHIPVICCGGIGEYDHFPAGVLAGGAAAVSAANIFHFFELSYPIAKSVCIDAGLRMRPIKLNSKWIRREPMYDDGAAQKRLDERIARVHSPTDTRPLTEKYVRWCTKCVNPAVSASPIEFDEQGVCSGCRVSDMKSEITTQEWDRRIELLGKILEDYRAQDGTRYDCVIPVSGGKDSWYQTHIIKNIFGLRPLLVTYNGNNYTPAGWRNVHRMKEVFGVDHVFFSPSVPLLKKLNRLAFLLMGDMNWHCHVGITTLPIRIAVQNKIPLLIWGEHGYLDLCGQFSMDDFPEMSYRDRLEHFARMFEWNYFVGTEEITAQDMLPYQYPSDQELFELDVRGLYIGNYINWEANTHGKEMVEKFGFELSDEPFDRTYRRMSNLDDMHENGVHDYLKYIKFGYGRCTDHVCKDIRAGLMTREEGIELIRRYDHVKPRDLKRWLEYVGMKEEYFDDICDTFRDRRVWWHEGSEWKKHNIWDDE